MSILTLADGNAGTAAVLGGFGLLWLIVVGVILFLSVFWIWMLVDAATSSLQATEKLIWVLVILFTHIVGAALYFFIARRGARTGAA